MSKLISHNDNDDVNTVCFSPHGTTFATGSKDKTSRLWDVMTGQQVTKLDGHSHSVMFAGFTPDCTSLASGSVDNSIRLWDVKTGQQKAKLDGYQDYVNSICFSHDGTTLASGSQDYSIRLWNVKTGQQKAKLDGHSSCVQTHLVVMIVLSAYGCQDMIIKAGLDGHSHSVIFICFTSDSAELAYDSYDNSICLWDVKTTAKELLPQDNFYREFISQ